MPPVILLVAGGALAAAGGILIVTTTLTFASFWVSTLIFTGVSTALGGVSALLQKAALNRALNNEIKGRQVTVRQPAAPRRIIYGILVRIGGIITYLDARGTDNEFLDLVITLTGREINNIGNMYFDGKAVGIDGNGDGVGIYLGLVHIEKNLGSVTQAAFPGLVADSGGKWTAVHQQKGCAGVYVRLKWDSEVFPRGVPNITFDVGGVKVFDPRGPSTVVSENPALCEADYLTDTDFGFGVDFATRIDEPELITAANACEEQVNLDGGGAEDRYTVNGSFTTDQDPFSVINALRAAMAGYITDVGGKWMIMAGVFRAPTVTLGLSDLRGSISLTSNQARRDSFNSVKGTYTNAAHKWQPTDFPVVTNATYVSEDGGRKIYLDMDLPFTVSSPTAQRIAKIELERSRLQRIAKLPCKMTAYQLQPGDTVTLNMAPIGLTAAVYEVLEVALVVEQLASVPTLGVDLTVRATASTVFDWNETIDEGADPAPPDTNPPDPTVVPTPTGHGVAWEDAANPDLINTIRAHLTWTAIPDLFVRLGGWVEVEYKASASGTWIAVEPVPGHHTELDVGGIFSEGTDYDFRIRARNIHGVAGLYQTITNQTATGTGSAIGSIGTAGQTHGQNVLRNWNFEDTTEAFWGSTPGGSFVIETITANAHTGNKYGVQQTQNEAVEPADHLGNRSFFPVQDGDIIEAGGWGFPVGAGPDCFMQLLMYDGDKALKRVAFTTENYTIDAWTLRKSTTTVLVDELYCVPFYKNGAGASRDFRVDDCFLRIYRPAEQITEDASRSFTHPDSLDANRRVDRVRLFDDSADLIDGASLINMFQYHDSAARLLATTILSGTTSSSTFVSLSMPYSPILGRSSDYSATMRVKLNTLPVDTFGPDDPVTGADDTASGGTEPWLTPGNAVSSNNAYATVGIVNQNSTKFSHFLKTTDYAWTGGDIPSGDVIKRVKIEVEGNLFTAGSGSLDGEECKLFVGGFFVGTQRVNTAGAFGGADSIITWDYDLSAAGWNTSITPAQANATDFGVGLVVEMSDTGTGTTDVSVDTIQITITTDSSVYVMKGRIDIGGVKSNEITLTGPAVLATGTVTIAGLAKGTRTVDTEGEITSQNGNGGVVQVELDQIEYEDQGKEHFV